MEMTTYTTPKERLTVAFFQQDIAWEQPEANHRMVEEAFSRLAQPADVLVVPETFATGFSDCMAAMAEPQEGATLQFARRMARQHDSLFVGTWTVREKGQVVNRLHWVYPDGRYGWYDKAHTFRMSSEASQLARGTRRVIFEWRGWRVKPAVCYDLRFPLWLRQTAPEGACEGEEVRLGYDLMIVCANWPQSRYEAWSTLLRARAIENLSYVVGVNRVGTDGVEIPYSGDSMAVDYKGHTLASCAHGEASVAVATLDYETLRTFRSHWPFYLDFDRVAPENMFCL